jgi:hypothetical protein
VDEYGLGGLGLLGLPYRVPSTFCENLTREHLAQPHGPMWRGDLSGENLFRGHASTVILSIRVISCANDRSFERDTGKQALRPAISVDCGYGRDRSFRMPTYGPGGHTDITSQRYVHVSGEGFHSLICVMLPLLASW